MKEKSFSHTNYQRQPLTTPNGEKSILLHTCCAPCAGEIMLALKASAIKTVLFFYNPNIHPQAEYLLRKEENKRYADKLNMEFIDADYDKENWFHLTKGLEWLPERGKRCSVCFDMRFAKTATYAAQHGYQLISSTLGISRWKDMHQINRSGILAVKPYNNVQYWTLNWRKGGGSQRMIEISKQENFYKQEYCGCVYSLRDTNKRRTKNNRTPIKRGVNFY